jgi:DNA helicase IV
VDTVVETCRRRLNDEGTVGVIAADADVADLHRAIVAAGLPAVLLGQDEDALEIGRLVCVPASLAKGLEFDTVLAVEPARIVAAEPWGLRRLYVVLTRAVTALDVIHAEPLPAGLAGDYGSGSD